MNNKNIEWDEKLEIYNGFYDDWKAADEDDVEGYTESSCSCAVDLNAVDDNACFLLPEKHSSCCNLEEAMKKLYEVVLPDGTTKWLCCD